MQNKIKCLTIIHIFYENLISELSEHVKNITGVENDIYITIPPPLKNKTYFIQGLFPNAYIFTVNNIGFDIYPFLYILNKVDLNHYDFLIKIHTKRDMPFERMSLQKGTSAIGGSLWREKLLGFLSSKQNFITASNMLKNKEVGIVSTSSLLLNYELDGEKEIYPDITKIMRSFGFEYSSQAYFVAGTMFIAKAFLFKFLQNSFSEEDFKNFKENENKQGLAHILERVIGYAVYAQGFKIVDYQNRNVEFEIIKAKLKNFLFEKCISKRHIIYRFLRIPFYYQKKQDKIHEDCPSCINSK